MSLQERRYKEQQLRGEDIVNAAEKLFGEKGLNSVTIDEIAKAAEYSKRTVYMYFKSKQDIIRAVALRGFSELNRMIEQEIETAKPQDGAQKIRCFADALIRFSEHKETYFKIVNEYQNSPEDFVCKDASTTRFMAESEKGFSLLLESVKTAQQDGSISNNESPQSIALTLWSALSGSLYLLKIKAKYLTSIHKISSTQCIDLLSKTLEKALFVNTKISKRGN